MTSYCNILLKGIIEEDFINYKKPSMLLMFPHCSFKCGRDLCQNTDLERAPNIEVSPHQIIERYISNPITQAIICSGLEPFDSFSELYSFISLFRYNYNKNDDIVIYSGYTEEEVKQFFSKIFDFENLIIKYGRYIPGAKSHIDKILGVELQSPNQYAKLYNRK